MFSVYSVVPFFLTAASLAAAPATYRYFETTDSGGKIESVSVTPDVTTPLWARDVSQAHFTWPAPSEKPILTGPIRFVKPPADAGEPFYPHNHQPSLTWLDNGDLLAIWYSTKQEIGPELTVLASRFRHGATEWDASSAFFKSPGRNMHGSSIFRDREGNFHHINGMAPAGGHGWDILAMFHRTSRDNGVTWTAPDPVCPIYRDRQQVISGAIQTSDGAFVQPCDAVPGAEGGSNLQISRDGGKSWTDPGRGQPQPDFAAGSTGSGTIAGIHAGVVQLKDGSLLALGRGNAIDGHMPESRSSDFGKTWTYSASPFFPIGGGQRLILRRLNEGQLLFVGFTSGVREKPRARGMEFPTADGGTLTGYGLYAVISEDEGKTWPIRKLITPGSGDFDGGAWTGEFTATPDNAEPAGYLAATQTPDNVIHLISSALHYRFNLPWLRHPDRESATRKANAPPRKSQP